MKRMLSLVCASALLLSGAMLPVCADETAPAAEKIRIACVGDSLTEGTCCSDKETTSYPAVLSKLVDESRYEVKNFGSAGRAAMKKYDRGWSYWDNAYYTQSLAYEPNIVLLMMGTNDVIHARFDTDYETDMTALIESYKALPSAPTVYLITAPVANDSRKDNLQNKLIPAQKKIAEATGCTLIDFNTETLAWSRDEYYSFDGLHLSDYGYYCAAEFFCSQIFGTSELKIVGDPSFSVTVGGKTVSAAEENAPVLSVADGAHFVTVTNGTESGTFEIRVEGGTTLRLSVPADSQSGFVSPTVTYDRADAVASEASEALPSQTAGGIPTWCFILLAVLAALLAAGVIVYIIKKGK